MTAQTLTTDERVLVALISAGYTRWRIAEVMTMSEDAVREMVRELCARFDCRMERLPEAVRKHTL